MNRNLNNLENVNTYTNLFGATFMSKVFLFFGLAIASSALGAYMGLHYFAKAMLASPMIFYGLIIGELIMIFTSGFWSKRKPFNYVLFVAFTFITGMTLVPVLIYLMATAAGTAILIKAFVATALMFGACAIFGYTTNINLSGLRGFLTMSLIGLLIVGVLGLFLPWNNTFEMIYAGAGAIIFSGYTMYDIQKLKSYPEDSYIDAAIQLYLDIFNLFMFIIRIISAQQD